MEIRRFKISPREAAFFQFILESYDGIFSVSTLDSRMACLEVRIPRGWSRQATDILVALQREIVMEELY